MSRSDGEPVEVADRVWVARHTWLDVNVTVVGGARGLLVVDTHASGAAARELRERVGRLGAGDVVAVANTHEHFDHTFGNAVFRDADPAVPLVATEHAAAATAPAGERARAAYRRDEDDPHRAEVLATRVLPADTTFSSAHVVDLGDRFVELVHPGRGHTAGDLVARIPDADVVLAGDLVEESAPPSYGADAFPLEWPGTLDVVVGMLTSDSTVVPGHGAVVGRAFVEDQRADVALLATLVSELAAAGVPVEDALAGDTAWPWPRADVETAVRLAYAHLPRGARRLPLA
jgi:glyoxylase-like metal-dependent hydrolase (beta-lactamase superfamily II)